MDVSEKIAQLRRKMAQYGLAAYIIPSSDPHLSEYVADHWKARQWFTGFTGSAGTFVVTHTQSGLWTDGRYYIQAEKQLAGSEIKLFKMGSPGVPSYIEWIKNNINENEYVGFPGKMVPVSVYKDMQKQFQSKNIKIIHRYDLVDEIWQDRPAVPAERIFYHDIKYSGISAKEKIRMVREKMKELAVDYYFISSLDDIAWLFNIRGNDIAYIPVTISYALLSMNEAYLFINPAKVPEDVRKILGENEIKIMDYEELSSKLSVLEKGKTVAFNPKKTNCWIYNAVHPDCEKIEIDEITTSLKAIKNDTELKNLEMCQIHDGIAMVRFLMWLEQNIVQQNVTELSAAKMLNNFRMQQENNIGLSFETIAAYGEHGAMMHYSATQESNYTLRNKGLMVLDSGGQYINGTTDITRTIVFKEVSEEERFDFTMVLKAHIALASAKFLYGATGSNLDILARKPLWDIGLDYKCGTGHGVGYCLSVHEGPQNFSQTPNQVKLEKGMIVTIEPGIYKEGKYGIRIENMVKVVEAEKTESGQFMKFEPITYCPIDLNGINADLLSDYEKNWLNEYHCMVYNKLSPHLTDEEKAWLREKTRAIQ